MNKVVDFSSVHYAVIAGLHTETGLERLVITYRNEESLRDLIAAPSIIAVGFSTREEAVAGGGTEKYQHRLNWAKRRGQTSSILRRLARLISTSYSGVATAAVAIFFSRNAISAVIRIALGSSV